MNSKAVIIVDGDDWNAVYVNGKLVTQGHNINWKNVLKTLNIPTTTYEANLDWIHEEGQYPENFWDVKLDGN